MTDPFRTEGKQGEPSHKESSQADMLAIAKGCEKWGFSALVAEGKKMGVARAHQAVRELIQQGALKTKPCLDPADEDLNSVWSA